MSLSSIRCNFQHTVGDLVIDEALLLLQIYNRSWLFEKCQSPLVAPTDALPLLVHWSIVLTTSTVVQF